MNKEINLARHRELNYRPPRVFLLPVILDDRDQPVADARASSNL